MSSKIKQITAHLFQGALAHVASEGIPDAVDLVFLMAQEAERIALPVGKRMTFVYLPIADDPTGCSGALFEKLRSWARSAYGHNVLTICHMGENRSGLMSALILYEVAGYTGNSAVTTVQQYGPINSSHAPHALWNPGFVKQIRELDDAGTDEAN